MEKLNNKTFIFDLDGTLIDTEKIYQKLWPKAVSCLGYEMTNEMYLSLRSLGRPFAPIQFQKWYGDEFDYNKARGIRKELFREYVREHGMQAKAGAVELLSALKEKGIETAIATATDLERANAYLEMTDLSGFFDHVISATMVEEGKPSPKVYQYACKQLGKEPAECVAVEDAPNGILSAHRAGLSVIMVPDLSQPDEEIHKLLLAKVDCLTDILSLL